MFPEAILSKSSLLLKAYTGEAGKMNVVIKYGSQTADLTFIVIEGLGPSLLG